MNAITVGTGKSLHRRANGLDGQPTDGTACGAEWKNGRRSRTRLVKGDPNCARCTRIVNQ